MAITLDPSPTIWASDANFSSGPNTGTPTRVDPGAGYFAQGWIPGQTVPGQFANHLFGEITDYLDHIRDQISGFAIDGVNGGTYTLVAPLIFAGHQVRIASTSDLIVLAGATLDVSGAMTVSSGASATFSSGSALTLDSGSATSLENTATFTAESGSTTTYANGSVVSMGGDMTITGVGNVIAQSGSEILLNSGAELNLESGALQIVQSGATISSAGSITSVAGGVITVEDQNDLVINDSTENFRLAMTPTWLESVSGTLAWDRDASIGPGFLVQKQVDVPTDQQYIAMFPVLLPPGDTISTLIVQLEGGLGAGHGGGLPEFLPEVRLVRVDISGTTSTVDSEVDGSGSTGVYDATHTITLTPAHLLDASYAYYVIVLGESGTNAVANTTGISAIYGQAISRSFRGAGNAMGYA